MSRSLEEALKSTRQQIYKNRQVLRTVSTTVERPDDGSRVAIQITEIREASRENKLVLAGYVLVGDDNARNKHYRIFLDGCYWRHPASVMRYLVGLFALPEAGFNWSVGKHERYLYAIPPALDASLDTRSGDLEHLVEYLSPLEDDK